MGRLRSFPVREQILTLPALFCKYSNGLATALQVLVMWCSEDKAKEESVRLSNWI